MKKTYFLFVFALSGINSNAQITARISNGELFIPNASWTPKPYYGTMGTFFADVTGDGKADVLVVNDDKITMRPSDGNSFVNYRGNKPWTSGPFYGSRGTYFADVNGDGKADAIAVGDDFVWVRPSDGSSFFNYLGNKPWTSEPYYGTRGTYFADVTGDGKADAIVVNDDKITVRVSDGTKFLPNAAWTSRPYFGTRGTYFADVNGDRRADAIAVNDGMVTVYPSDGNSFVNYRGNRPWTSEPYYGSRGTYFADVNGDGKADAIVVNDDRVTARISDGTKFLPNASWTSEPYYGTRGTYFADVNGDKRADAIVVNGDGMSPDVADDDNDGIGDEEEQSLLEKFRPYYKFSLQGGDADDYRPTDVLWYIQNSEIITTQDEGASPIRDNNLLASRTSAIVFNDPSPDGVTPFGSSDIDRQFKSTHYYVNPLNDKPGRSGAEWSNVLSSKNIGLYGHVVPIKLQSVQSYDRTNVPQESDPGETFYKIEYWQFFGYNKCHNCPTFDHEGDWITVQLLYNPRSGSMETVFYYIHGKLEIRFDLAGSKGPFEVSYPSVSEKFVEYQGSNYGNSCYADAKYINGDNACSNNTIRFCEDPAVAGQFTHPLVYIEYGAHEPWPTWNGFFAAVPNHNGDDYEHSFLTSTPPNLGEVEFPMESTPGAFEILRFNGRWGAKNDGAKGPSLHKQWTWPANSKIRAVKDEMDD